MKIKSISNYSKIMLRDEFIHFVNIHDSAMVYVHARVYRMVHAPVVRGINYQLIKDIKGL